MSEPTQSGRQDPVQDQEKEKGDFGRLFESITAAAGAVSAVFRHRIRLFALECRLAGLSLAAMLAGGLMMGLLAFTAWALVICLVVLGLHALGLGWASSILVVLALIGLSLFMIWRFIRTLSQNLVFRASRRQRQAPPPDTTPSATQPAQEGGHA